MKKKIPSHREGYVDIAKAIGIICVILGHISTIPAELKTYIYAFHMPLFFLCYGLIPRKNISHTAKTALEFVRKRFDRLLVPYFLWALIYSEFSFHNLGYILFGSRQTLYKSDSLTSLWFLLCMFLSVILFEAYFWSGVHKKWHLRYLVLLSSLTVSAVLPLIPIGYPWGFSVAINGFAFMLIGLIIKDLLEKILALRVWIIALIFVLCAVLSLSYKLNNPARGFVLMAHGEYGGFVPFMLGAFWGCCAVIMLAISVIVSVIAATIIARLIPALTGEVKRKLSV